MEGERKRSVYGDILAEPYRQNIEEALSKITDQNKILQKRLVHVESTFALLERRLDALEHHVFELREKDRKYHAIEKFLLENFPAFKAYHTGKPTESSSRTVTTEKKTVAVDEAPEKKTPAAEAVDKPPEKKTPATEAIKIKASPDTPKVRADDGDDEKDEGFASTCGIDIARRMQQRDDRKPKVVKTPFTTGQNKKRKMRMKQTVKRPTPMEKLAAAACAIIDVDNVKSPEPRPAPTEIDYPGRATPAVEAIKIKASPDAPKVRADDGYDEKDESFASTYGIGIARRMQQRDDRKPKVVKTPFTTGQNKKWKRRTKQTVKRPTPMEKLAAAACAIIDVDNIKSPEPRPAPTKIDYPRRATPVAEAIKIKASPDAPKVRTNDEDDEKDEGFASTCGIDIARRMQQMDDRKPKVVKTSFTTGQNKKRRRTKQTVKRPTPMEKLAAAACAIIDVDNIKSPEPRPTPT